MGLTGKTNFLAIIGTFSAAVAVAIAFSACGSSGSGGGTAAAVPAATYPASSCINTAGAAPYGTPGYPGAAGYPGYGTAQQPPYGYGGAAYPPGYGTPGYAGAGYPGAGYPGAGYGGAAYPNSYYTGAGISPYGYNNANGCSNGVPTCYPNGGGMQCIPQTSMQNFGYSGYNPAVYQYNNTGNSYSYAGFYAYANLSFNYNPGIGGAYYPNQYVQGCDINSWLNSCGFGGMCRQIQPNSPLGICVR